MATEVKYAIRTQAGWDGMSAPEQAEYAGHFDTLTAWEAIIPADLVAIDEQWTAYCYNDWPEGLINSNVFFPPRVVDGTHMVSVIPAEGEGYYGLNSSQGFLLTTSSDWDSVILIDCDWMIIRNIRLSRTGSGAGIALLDSENCIISNLHIAIGSASSSNVGLLEPGDGSIIENCMVYGAYNGYRLSDWSAPIVSNCIAVDCDNTGFNKDAGGSTEAQVVNCISIGAGSSDFLIDANTSYYNASSDLTASGVGGITGITDAEFIDATGGDYHLTEISQLRGAGLNLIENPPNLPAPQYDIDGDEWPATGAWDIGFDYYSGTVTPPTEGTLYLNNVEVSNMILNGGTRVYLGDTLVFDTGVVNTTWFNESQEAWVDELTNEWTTG